MKKGLLVLVTLAVMLAVLAGSAVAEVDSAIYLDGSGAAHYHFDSTAETDDRNVFSAVFGASVLTERFKASYEEYAGVTSLDNWDVTQLESKDVKIGLALVNIDSLRLDATLGYHKFSTNGSKNPLCEGLLVGFDFCLNPGGRLTLEGAVGYSDRGVWNTTTLDDVDATLMIYQLKCNLMLLRKLGVSAGYRYYSYRPESTYDVKHDFFGFYYGLVWRFGNYNSDDHESLPSGTRGIEVD